MNNKYSFSFTGAGSLLTETIIIAEIYLRLKDWDKVKSSIQKQNLLNKIKDSTFQREFREIKKRLDLLTEKQNELLISGGSGDAKSMVLISLIKTYALLRDFIIEVIRTKYFLFENMITESDYKQFISSKAISHQEINDITAITAQKVKTVIFRILEEIGLITSSKTGIIVKPYLSDVAIAVIVRDDASLLAGFLYDETEINTLKLKLGHGKC